MGFTERKLDKGETLEQCAVREVREETGLKKSTSVSVDDHLPYFHEGTKFILKESYWFSMTVKDDEKLVPQQKRYS